MDEGEKISSLMYFEEQSLEHFSRHFENEEIEKAKKTRQFWENLEILRVEKGSMGNCVAGNGRVSPVPGAIIPHDFQKSEKFVIYLHNLHLFLVSIKFWNFDLLL